MSKTNYSTSGVSNTHQELFNEISSKVSKYINQREARIVRGLQEKGWNQTEIARLLGVTKETMSRKYPKEVK